MKKADPDIDSETEAQIVIWKPQVKEIDPVLRLAAFICPGSDIVITIPGTGRQYTNRSRKLASFNIQGSIIFHEYASRSRDLFIIRDTEKDRRFANASLYPGKPKFRFYVRLAIRHKGSIAAIIEVYDKQPKQLTRDQKAALRSLSSNLVAIIESHHIARQHTANNSNPQHLNAILLTASEGIISFDKAGTCTYINEKAQALLGYSKDECLKKSILQLLLPLNKKGSNSSLMSLRPRLGRNKEIKNARSIFWRKDGSYLHVEYSYYPLKNGTRHSGAVIRFSDIRSELPKELNVRHYQQELEFLLEERQRILDNSFDIISTIDRNGVIININEACRNILGYEAKRIVNRKIFGFIHGEDVKRTKIAGLKSLAGQVSRVTNRFIKKDRSRVDISWVVQWNERKQNWICVGKDVTETKRQNRIRQIHYEILSIQNSSLSFEQKVSSIFKIVATHTEIDVVELWVRDKARLHFNKLQEVYSDPKLKQYFSSQFDRTGLKKQALFLKRLLEEDMFYYCDDLIHDPYFQRKKQAKKAHLKTGIVLPLIFKSEVNGFLSMFSSSTIDKSYIKEALTPLLSAVSIKVEYDQLQEELNRFFDLNIDIRVIVDAQGNRIGINTAYAKILGYAEKDVVGKSILSNVHPDDIEKIRAGFSAIHSRDEHCVRNFQAREKCKDGNYKWIDWTIGRFGDKGYVYASGRDVTDQKEMEQKLIVYTDRLNKVLESITQGFLVVNRSWNVTYLNKAAEQQLLLNKETALGKNIWELFPDATRLSFYHYYQKAFDTGIAVKFEEFYAPLNAWFSIQAYPSASSLAIMFRDTTEELSTHIIVEIEREALELNARQVPLKNVIDNMLERIGALIPGICTSVYIVDTGNRLRLESCHGIPAQFMQEIGSVEIGPLSGCCGTAAYYKNSIISPDLLTDPRWEKYADVVKQAGFRSCWSFPVMSSTREVLATFAIYHTQQKEPTSLHYNLFERFSSFLALLIESRNIKKALEKSNERYHWVLRATNDAIWDLDLVTGNSYWGEGYRSLFGYDTEGHHGFETWKSYVDIRDKERVIKKLEDALSKKLLYWEDEYRYHRADGSLAYVFDRAYIIYNERNEPVRMVGAMQDNTRRKESEQALLALTGELKQQTRELVAINQELERFVYVASHDLQEPLRMVTSFLQLLRKKYDGQLDEAANKYIYFAVDGADQMKRLINDLLVYSRIRKENSHKELVDLNELMKDVTRYFGKTIYDTKAVLVIDDMPRISANRSLLTQLFQNIIGNALKYRSAEVPKITIRFEESQEYWKFSVKDNGIGIEDKYFDQILVPFLRLHSRSEYPGTGIGLAICKKVVDMYDGNIWVESQIGSGSTFYFTLKRIHAIENGQNGTVGNPDR